MGRKRILSTLESWMIENGKSGDIFYTDKSDRHMTAFSISRGRKLTTERLITVTKGGKEPKAKYITKVTLL